jgi:hypothetical protein
MTTTFSLKLFNENFPSGIVILAGMKSRHTAMKARERYLANGYRVEITSRRVPLTRWHEDTPSLDDSFHRHEMDV